MPIEIRSIKTEDEYHAVEQLQREIWGAQDIEIVAYETLMTAQKNGGVMLGAFDEEKLVGFVFGFVGLTADGRVKHCSHIAGVLADYRDRNVGYALKLKQRELALAQGIELMTWTFDPLESRNARFNFHKLGATCDTYLRNWYGAMRDKLNAGLPSDRFQVDWRIASPRVESRLGRAIADQSPATLLPEDVFHPLLNPPIAGQFLRPAEKTAPIAGERALIQIPSDFQSLKAADRELALAWRLHTRALFEEAFAKGYQATDLLIENGRSYYCLERNPSVPADVVAEPHPLEPNPADSFVSPRRRRFERRRARSHP
jgi:predicted GNAT superfamily acetyltransferase